MIAVSISNLPATTPEPVQRNFSAAARMAVMWPIGRDNEKMLRRIVAMINCNELGRTDVMTLVVEARGDFNSGFTRDALDDVARKLQEKIGDVISQWFETARPTEVRPLSLVINLCHMGDEVHMRSFSCQYVLGAEPVYN